MTVCSRRSLQPLGWALQAVEPQLALSPSRVPPIAVAALDLTVLPLPYELNLVPLSTLPACADGFSLSGMATQGARGLLESDRPPVALPGHPNVFLGHGSPSAVLSGVCCRGASHEERTYGWTLACRGRRRPRHPWVPWSPTSNPMLASHSVPTWHRDSWVDAKSTAGECGSSSTRIFPRAPVVRTRRALRLHRWQNVLFVGARAGGLCGGNNDGGGSRPSFR